MNMKDSLDQFESNDSKRGKKKKKLGAVASSTDTALDPTQRKSRQNPLPLNDSDVVMKDWDESDDNESPANVSIVLSQDHENKIYLNEPDVVLRE